MFWLERPPVLRWIAAAMLVIGSAALDLAEGATVPFPFVVAAVARGDAVSADVIEWRDVPVGLLGDPAAAAGFAARDLTPGEALVAGAVTDAAPVPSGWWAVPVELPEGTSVGIPVRLVSLEPSLDVEGVVAQTPSASALSVGSGGLVAVPPDSAGTVARAATSGRLVVLVGT